ncbi:hypothetical protein V6N13_082668 [Hibiscus sabdariffa]
MPISSSIPLMGEFPSRNGEKDDHLTRSKNHISLSLTAAEPSPYVESTVDIESAKYHKCYALLSWIFAKFASSVSSRSIELLEAGDSGEFH